MFGEAACWRLHARHGGRAGAGSGALRAPSSGGRGAALAAAVDFLQQRLEL